MAIRLDGPGNPGRALRCTTALLVTLSGGSGACLAPPDAPYDVLAAAIGDIRPFEMRLSHGSAAPCDLRWNGPRRPVRCPGELTPPILAHLASLAPAIAVDKHPASSRRAAALLDLITSSSPQSVGRTVDALVEAALADSTNASAQNDAAVALYVSASERDRITDILPALDMVERALRADARFAPAVFNRALLFERLQLPGVASAAWDRAARLDAGAWRRIAVGRRAALHDAILGVAAASAGELPDPDSVFARLRSADDSEALRTHALSGLLPVWNGSTNAADPSWSSVVRIGEAAAARGDSIVRWLVESVERSGASHAASAAAAMAYFGQAEALFRTEQYGAAEGRFRAAIAILDSLARIAPGLSRGFRAGSDWVALRIATLKLYGGKLRSADSIHGAVLARHQEQRGADALAGHARWGLALSAFRRGSIGPSAATMEAAAVSFGRSGDRLARGSVQAQLVEWYESMGLTHHAVDAALAGLETIKGDRLAPPLLDALLAFGYALERMGAWSAAVAAQREFLQVTTIRQQPTTVAEGYLRLGRVAAVGRLPDASAAFDSALSTIQRLPDGTLRPRLRADLADALARWSIDHDPVRATAEADSAVAHYATTGLKVKLPSILAVRAQALLRSGDAPGARHDLARATALLDSLVASPGVESGDGLAGERDAAYRDLVNLTVALGDTSGALRLARRSRWETPPNAGPGRGSVRPDAPTGPFTPPATIGFLVDDRAILRWVDVDGKVTMRTLPTGTAAVADATRRFETAARSVADTAVLAGLARGLFTTLLGGAEPVLDLVHAVDLHLDGVLERVPFAALQDPRTGRYLVESHTLTHVTLGRPVGPWQLPRDPSLLLVDGSDFDGDLFPELAALPGARAEATAIGGLYRAPAVMRGAAATRTAVVNALAAADILHFAGHARSIEGQPSGSHLVLPVAGNGVGEALFSGAQIRPLDLGRLHLAVLSACGTVQRAGLTGRRSSLARAFLEAGARGVVASVWEVDDGLVLPLVSVLHTNLRRGPAAALRLAQLAMLADPDPNRRAVGAWAGFRYER